MNRNIYVLLCILAILLTSCNNSKPKDVSRNNHERIEKEEQEKWEVTDISDHIHMLDIDNTMEMNYAVDMVDVRYLANYIQVYEGHYYYMTYKNNIYTIHMDRGQEVGKFRCNSKYDISHCAKYGDNFYVIYREISEISEGAERKDTFVFGCIDFKSQSITQLFCGNTEEINRCSISICNNRIYLCDSDTQVIEAKSFKGENIGFFDVPTVTEEGHWYTVFEGVDKRNLYYSMYNKAENYFKAIHVNKDTGEKGVIFEGQTEKMLSRDVDGAPEILRDDDSVYIIGTAGEDCHKCLYIAEVKEKKIRLVSSYVKSWTVSDHYIFYADKKGIIHRWNREDGKDRVISKIKASNIKCSGNELYIREYDKVIDDAEWEDVYFETNEVQPIIYAMDFDGKNVGKCMGAK